jgi:rare lipoprotein A
MIFSFPKRSLALLLAFCIFPISLFAADTLTKEATYYADAFQWLRTANGDTFDQNAYSAAMCDVPLGQYLYVSHGNTGVVVDLNDRPSCSRFPQIVDLSTAAFKKFSPLTIWRVDGVRVTPMGPAPTDRAKSFLSSDTFQHLSITLTNQIPTILFSGDTIEVSGRVWTNDQYVLLYILKEGTSPVNKLIKVAKDKTFRWYITLPDVTGDVVFVVASGNSFDTDKYATLTLISRDSIVYPSITQYTRAKITPKITYNTSGEPMIRLQSSIYGQLEIRQWKKLYRAQWNHLLIEDLPLSLWNAWVKISGYGLSTPSPLDRGVSYPNLFSGTVLLERSHDTIGGDQVFIQNKITQAKFRFKTPTSYRVRGKYYTISPLGAVKEISFPKSSLDRDGFLLPGIIMSGSLNLDTIWTYLLEIVREDGIAFANIPITRGNAWPVIDPLTEKQISEIRSDSNLVVRSTIDRINTLRNSLWKTPLTSDSTLSKLAQAKVDDMIRRGYQGHADPDGNYIDHLAEKLGLESIWSIGENIGYGTVSDLSLQDGLEESGVHKINMLQSVWSKVGVGYGVNEGKVYLVHIFSE